jgi:Sec-independent protein secretion pathway component TatC
MLNLDETLLTNTAYTKQRDLYIRVLAFSLAVIVFVEILRAQVSEVNILQLIPGYYLILLLFSLVFLVVSSNFFNSLFISNDEKRSLGTKTKSRLETTSLLRFSVFLFFACLITIFNSVIPLSLDSFNNYGEKTLENVWSFDEVLGLEITLFIILVVISQIPVIVVANFSNEKDVNTFPEYWKGLSLFIFVIAGILTPTIDGYTQLSFAISAVSLYFLIINITEKKVNVKFSGTSILGS